jgi:hypothetical protein
MTTIRQLAERLRTSFGINRIQPCEEAATILLSLADADAKMPVVAWAFDDPEYGFPGTPCRRFDDVPPGRAVNSAALMSRDDAQAAILAATERAEKAEKDAARWRALPAFLEEFQIDYVNLIHAVDQYLKDEK